MSLYEHDQDKEYETGRFGGFRKYNVEISASSSEEEEEDKNLPKNWNKLRRIKKGKDMSRRDF